MIKNKEKGFALILSIILLIVMSLMGGSLIVISSGDHQSNNNSDQYQQTFYVAETGLIEGEKWILDNYLGHWMNSIPSDKDVLGEIPDSPGPLSDYNVRKEIWDDKKNEYDEAKEGGYFRHTFGRGPAVNDTTVNRTDSKCLSSFKILLCKVLLDVARICPPFSAVSFLQFVTTPPEFLIIGIKGNIS